MVNRCIQDHVIRTELADAQYVTVYRQVHLYVGGMARCLLIYGAHMPTKEELIRRADLYAQRQGLVLGEQLGFGVHGIVFVAMSKAKLERAAIKIHEREGSYQRERDVYLRLRDHGISQIRDSQVPRLLRYDDELWVIEMGIVTRPFVLDFADAYLDEPPDYTDEVFAEWRTEKEEQFGDRWSDVELVLSLLRRYGVYLIDVSPSNIAFSK